MRRNAHVRLPRAASANPPAKTRAGRRRPTLHPRADPARGSAAPPSSRGLFSRRIVGWATSSRTGHRQRGRRPRAGDPGGASTATAATSRAWSTTATTDLSTCPSPTPDDSSTRAPVASAGAVGSSYDNAAAEALNKSYKRELVWRDGPWKDRDDLETATARWVDWYNRTRPHRANPDDLPPAAAEHRYNHNHTTTTAAAPATA